MKRHEEEGERYNHKCRMPTSLQASPLDSQEIPRFFKLFKAPKNAQQVCIFRLTKCVEALFIKTLKMSFILVKTHGFRMGPWWSPGARLGLKNRKLDIWYMGRPGGAPGFPSGSKMLFYSFLLLLSFLLESFFFSRLDHLFLYENRKRVDEFLHLKIYNSTPKITKVWFFMYCSFHLKLCIFTTMYPQKSCTIQGKCKVKYVKLGSLSSTPPCGVLSHPEKWFVAYAPP